MVRIELGRPLHCVEINTGRNLTGILHLYENEISADIYSYSDLTVIDATKQIYFITQDAKTVSFHSNVSWHLGKTLSHGRNVYHQRIISNVAIVGSDRWTASDKMKSVSFSVDHTLNLLRHQDKLKAIGTSKFFSSEHWEIFKVSAEGMIIKAWYGASYGSDFTTPTDIWPIFGIEFDEPQNIHDYIEYVSNYVSFLSFCVGLTLTPKNIRIDQLSDTEKMDALKTATYRGGYDVYYVLPDAEIDSRDVRVDHSPVRAWDDRELGAFQACLVTWMTRGNVWKDAYALMMESLVLKKIISAERLIKPCRWFEVIPVSFANFALTDEDINAISSVATEKAKSLGHSPEIRKRIDGAIRRIRVESTRERFARLMEMVKNNFGEKILPENVVSHLTDAMQKFRGKTAHGHFNPATDEEFMAFTRSTFALEALCYLLIALDLPISDEGVQRVRNNPLVVDYHYASGWSSQARAGAAKED